MFSPLDSLIASYRCNKDNKHPAFVERNGLQDIVDAISEELVNALPHGSGIDCDWKVEHKEGLTFNCCNSWHSMDQNGSYCGYVDFAIAIDLSTMEFDIEVSQADIAGITSQYDIDDKNATDDEIEAWNESNACPCLDDLDDMLYEDIRFSLEDYFVRHAIKYAVQAYPDTVKRELAKALPEISKIDVRQS